MVQSDTSGFLTNVLVERKPVFAKPGSRVTCFLNIHGPEVRVSVSASRGTLVVEDVRPSTAVTPFTSMATIYISYRARVGAYEVDITVYDPEEKTALAAGTLIVFVLNDKLGSVAEEIHEYMGVLKQKGVEYTVLKILWDFNQAFTPTEVKAVYEMLLERSVSKGTVYDVLKRLLRKRLVVREPEGYVFNHKLKFHEAALAVDV